MSWMLLVQAAAGWEISGPALDLPVTWCEVAEPTFELEGEGPWRVALTASGPGGETTAERTIEADKAKGCGKGAWMLLPVIGLRAVRRRRDW